MAKSRTNNIEKAILTLYITLKATIMFSVHAMVKRIYLTVYWTLSILEIK